MATTQTNKELFQRVSDALNDRNFDAFADSQSDDVVLHDEESHGGKAAIEHERTRYDAFPDIGYTLDDLLAEGSMIAGWWPVTGPHEDELLDIQPTGESVEVQGIFLYPGEDGKLAEGIDMWDAYGVQQQLGVLPTLQATD